MTQPYFPHLHPLVPTEVLDTYWRFATERQRIFFKRFHGEPSPWTEDPILLRHKFTNAYRAADRVSQYLISEVIYNPVYPSDHNEVFFRIILFKLFNKIETWELLTRNLGLLTLDTFDVARYSSVLSEAMSNGHSVYSGAYIMPSGSRVFGFKRKHHTHLCLLEMMIADEAWKKIADCRTMQRAFYLLRDYPTIGDFLAYQYVTDINYSELTNFSEAEFVVPGPGALDGIRKCFKDTAGLTGPEVIKFVAEVKEQEFDRLGLNFQTLWGRPLQLIDCQNLFCEVDKYARERHPLVKGISGRTRIKQIFRPVNKSIQFTFPPKWGIAPKPAPYDVVEQN